MGRIIQYFGVANGAETEPRGINPGWLNPKSGWQGLATLMKTVQAKGIDRFLLWMPFGRDPMRTIPMNWNGKARACKSNLQFDQYVNALKADLPWLTGGFSAAVRPFTQAGNQVIAYLGTLPGAPEFEDASRGVQHEFFDRLSLSLQPILKAGCDVAFDTACGIAADSWHYYLIKLLQARGVKTYIEASPIAGCEHLKSENFICSTDQWVNVVNPANWAIPIQPDGFKGLIKPADLTGEKVLGIFNARPAKYATNVAWFSGEVPKLLADPMNFTVCAGLYPYFTEGGTLEQLLPPTVKAAA